MEEPAMSEPRLSIIIEWDNARYYEVERARRMLQRLSRQIAELGEPPGAVEVELLYDQDEIDGASATRVVAPIVEEHGVPIRLTATRGLKYYQLKNEGGRRARGDILLFVDSDVLPQEAWLGQLVRSFDDPRVDVVKGNAYVDGATLYGKAFALGWYFPPRAHDGPLHICRDDHVNNIAMRRHVFEKHPFTEDASLYIAQCSIWTRELQEAGIAIYVNPSARVAHPPPSFLRSALINGHDTARRTRRPGDGTLEAARRTYWALRSHLGPAFRNVRERRRDVGLSPFGVPAALAILGTYWSLWALAELLTRWAPGLLATRYLR
jgi:hypothetical protein